MRAYWTLVTLSSEVGTRQEGLCTNFHTAYDRDMSDRGKAAGKAVVVAQGIRQDIADGTLRPGDPIPTLTELRGRGVSVTTAREAHRRLREWGLVTGGRGAPLRVRVPHRRIVRSSERHQVEKDLVLRPEAERARWGTSEIELGVRISEVDFRAQYNRIAAGAELAAAMGIKIGVKLLERRYETRDPTTGYLAAASVSYIPLAMIRKNQDLVNAGCEPWPGGHQHQLYTVGIEVAEIHERVNSRPPIAEERDEWGMEAGDVLEIVRRKSVDVRGRTVELSYALFAASRTDLEWVTKLRPFAAIAAGNQEESPEGGQLRQGDTREGKQCGLV